MLDSCQQLQSIIPFQSNTRLLFYDTVIIIVMMVLYEEIHFLYS